MVRAHVRLKLNIRRGDTNCRLRLFLTALPPPPVAGLGPENNAGGTAPPALQTKTQGRLWRRPDKLVVSQALLTA